MGKTSFLVTFLKLLAFWLSIAYLNTSLNQTLAQQDTSSIRELINTSDKHFQNKSKEKAFELIQQSIDAAEKINAQKLLADSYRKIAGFYSEENNDALAMENFVKAEKIYRKVVAKKELSICLNNIANIYNNGNHLDKALSYYKEALNIQKEREDQKEIADLLNNIASINYQKGDHKKAISIMEEVLEIEKNELKREDRIATCYLNLGAFYQSLGGEEDKVEKNYLKALEILKNLDDDSKSKYCRLLFNLGTLSQKKQDYYKALNYYKECIAEAEIIEDKVITKYAYNAIYGIHEYLGNIPEAFDYFKRYVNLKDSLIEKRNVEQLNELQVEYETDKKEQALKIKDLHIQAQDVELNKKQVIIYSSMAGIFLGIILTLVIYRNYRIKQKANKLLTDKNQLIERQKDIIEEKNKDITDSIVYAKNIQQAILPDINQIRESLPESFVFFEPKDVVSGDFFWFHDTGKKVIIIAADCTGHGVPGAFVSMVGNNLLNQIIIEKKNTNPGQILTKLNIGVNVAFKRKGGTFQANDGMDISICSIDKDTMELEFAGAQNPLLQIRNGEAIVTKADHTPIGGRTSIDFSFKNHKIDIEANDTFYIFSDGYPDQFGGPKGKKFMIKRFKNMLIDINQQPLEEQGKHIDKVFHEWSANEEQIDDVLVIGFKIPS